MKTFSSLTKLNSSTQLISNVPLLKLVGPVDDDSNWCHNENRLYLRRVKHAAQKTNHLYGLSQSAHQQMNGSRQFMNDVLVVGYAIQCITHAGHSIVLHFVTLSPLAWSGTCISIRTVRTCWRSHSGVYSWSSYSSTDQNKVWRTCIHCCWAGDMELASIYRSQCFIRELFQESS